jgi:hypothetical protein
MERKKRGERFAKEFKKILATAIAAALGFITAFAWRDVLTEALDKVTGISPIQGKLINALIITIAAVLVFMLLAKINPEK